MKRVHHTNEDVIITKDYPSQVNDYKPKGLWYDINLSWLDWCDGNMPDWTYKNHFELDIDKSKILLIDTEKKLLEFDNAYSIQLTQRSSIKIMDWESVSKKYSGIEISPYQYGCRYDMLWYYGWDVASGCIWNFDCVKSINKFQQVVNKTEIK
jgi:hypothetical protein